ncbi:DUF1444 family protein [Winogradskyella undariae]|uniref:DUF1444 family protein n=1 Tax=Winogradskyella TaxID=286104 RepID=UPI00156AED5F|nr:MULTISPECIES: DUF1444 family protein [Winogradskyella]NRR92469.1 DUF1444 family protein [Winogradskyella undariae]QNK78484.1 DUF1444 family protein [Winogradskyella sp. PAMC22761]QXP78503.1 DUF1444 family protein [Winogradskyella sp. HaHa_3_26]
MSGTLYGKEKSQEEIEKIIEQTKNRDQKIYPILKPGDWVGLKAGALNSNLIKTEAGPKVVIAYGIDTPDNFVFLTQQHLETMDQKEITNEAFRNLGNYETEFTYSKAFQNKILTSSGHDFSSERILSNAHMLKAHAMLHAEELFVSVPRRSCMMVISRDSDDELLGAFLSMHKDAWKDDSYGNAPIANILFTMKGGHITGHIALDNLSEY